MHTVHVPCQREVSATEGGDIGPQLRQMRNRQVEHTLRHAFVSGCEGYFGKIERMSEFLQRGIERDARHRNRIAAPAQVEGRIQQHPPPDLPLPVDYLPVVFSTRQGDGIFDIKSHVVIAQGRDDTVRGAKPSQNSQYVRCEFRGADIDQIAAEDDEVGSQRIDRIHEPVHLPFRPHERADVQIRELHDPESVECGGQCCGPDFDFVHPQGLSAPSRSPYEPYGTSDSEERPYPTETPMPIEQQTEIIAVTTADQQQEDEGKPLGCLHPARRIVRYGLEQQHHDDRKRIRKHREPDEGAAKALGMPTHPHPVEEKVHPGKKQGEEKQKPDHIARFFRYRVQSLSGILSTDRPDGIVFAKIIR